MSISLISGPSILSYSKNKIAYKLQTDNYVTAAGSKAHVDFRIFSTTGSHYITFTWGSNTVTFTGGSLDNSGLKVRLYTSGTESDYLVNSLIPDLKSNQLLYETFEFDTFLSGSDLWIRMTARQDGTDYNVSVAYNSGLFNPVSVAGVNRAVRENFKINLELMLFDSDGDFRIIELEQVPDEDSYVVFEIQEYLDKYFETLDKDIPSFNASSIAQADNLIQKYYVRYYESYGDPSADYYVTSASDRYVINGGLQREHWPSNTFVSSLASNSKRFLTWQPGDKLVSTSQQEYLYYYLDDDTSEINLVLKVYFDDDTDSQSDVLTLSDPDQYGIFILPAGFSQLNIASLETGGRLATRYELSVTDADDTVISETRMYIVDRNEYQNERFYLYKNSLGGYETLRTYENAKKSTNIDFDISEKYLAHDYTAATGQRRKSNLQFNDEVAVSLGLLDKESKIPVQDLIISDDVYEIYSDRFVSIEVQNKDEEIFDEDEDLHPLILKYKINFVNQGFSNL